MSHEEALIEAEKMIEVIKEKREADEQDAEAESFSAEEYQEAAADIDKRRAERIEKVRSMGRDYQQRLKKYRAGVWAGAKIPDKTNAIKRHIELTDEQRVAEKEMIKCLSVGDIEGVLEIKERANISEEVVQEIAKQGMIVCLLISDYEKCFEIVKELNVSPEVINSPEVQQAAKGAIIEILMNGGGEDFLKIVEELNVSSEVTNSSEVQQAAKSTIIEMLKNGNIDDFSEFITKIIILDEVINSSEVMRAIKDAIIDLLLHGSSEDVEKIMFSKRKDIILPAMIDSPEVREAARRRMVDDLSQGNFGSYSETKGMFLVEDDVIDMPEFQQAAQTGMLKLLIVDNLASCIFSKKAINDFIEIKEEFKISEETAKEIAMAGAIKSLGGGLADGTRQIIAAFELPKKTAEYLNYFQPFQESLINLLHPKFDDMAHFLNFTRDDYYKFLSKTPERPVALEPQGLTIAAKLRITLKEAEEIKRKNESLEAILGSSEKTDHESLFEELRFSCKDWQDLDNVVVPFQIGSRIFGAGKMFTYLARPGLSRHDGLHAFSDVVRLYQASKLAPDQFFANILAQVNADGAGYESGTAHHQLNQIASSFDANFKRVAALAKHHQDITQLQKSIGVLNSPQAVFDSWSSLKRYSQLCEILNQAEMLNELKLMKKKGKTELYAYLETLAFHPSSKVDMKKVMEFWQNPEEFLAGDDDNTPEKIHNRKKPSNYTEIPNLDLTAEQLRDALVEGKMDELQVFSPLEIEYRIPAGEVNRQPLRDQIKTALGSFKEKINGQAKDPKKLFSQLQKVFMKYKLNLADYLAGIDLPAEIKAEAEKEIINQLYDPAIGLAKDDRPEMVFVAKINKKSSPEGVLAGNDTSSCMPFGSGKNTVYTFNPNTALFTLQIKRRDGTLRTIAQSVLTKDKDVKILVPEILDKMEQVGEKIHELVSEETMIEGLAYLTCDNMEVAPNFKKPEYTRTIERIYHDFFAEYMARFAQDQGLIPNEVAIGQGYSEFLSHLPTRPNTLVPLAPVGYSDNIRDEVYILDLTEPKQGLKRKITVPQIAKSAPAALPAIKGLDYLTFQDTLGVAYLEGKAYSDNESLIVYLYNIENGLIAKDINNADKGRPNLSLKYVDSQGKMISYIIAYEGVAGAGYHQRDKNDEDEKRVGHQPQSTGERIIYIEDFASDKKSPLAAGRIIKGFSALYRANYLDKNDLVPIYAEAREQTSYALIKKQFERLGRELGVEFELEELKTYTVGDDIMHPVMIRPKLKK
jgi:hypothetical protein